MKPVALVGVPYDEMSSFLRGPAQAPDLIRQNFHSGSSNYTSELGVDVAVPEVIDKHNLPIQAYFDIEEGALGLLEEGYRMLSLGGDHSITYPLLKAHSSYYQDIQILHIDAHADLYDSFDGDPHSHACPFARIMENKLASRLVQVGIRTLNATQQAQADRFGVEILEMRHYQLDRMPSFDQPIYLSIDLDGLDPAFAPGVSHHEPGGLSTRQVLDIIHSLKVPILGADIVEYNPVRDHQGITAVLAAKLMKEVLGKMLS